MRLVNLTNHDIHIINGIAVTIPVSGHTAHVKEDVKAVGWLEIGTANIPLIAKRYGEIEGLPPREPGTVFITSTIVAIAAWEAGRDDVVAPGELARDQSGKPVGCMNLAAR